MREELVTQTDNRTHTVVEFQRYPLEMCLMHKQCWPSPARRLDTDADRNCRDCGTLQQKHERSILV